MSWLERANDLILTTKQKFLMYNSNIDRISEEYEYDKLFHLGVFTFVVLTGLFGLNSIAIGVAPWIKGRRRRSMSEGSALYHKKINKYLDLFPPPEQSNFIPDSGGTKYK